MKLTQTPTLKSLSSHKGSTHDLTVRRARHVWRDKTGKVMLVAYYKHPEALLYTHRAILFANPDIETKVFPEFHAWLEEQGYLSMKLAILKGKPKQLEQLAVTRHWKLSDRAVGRVEAIPLPRGAEPCRGPEGRR